MLEKLQEKWEEILNFMKEEHDITDVSFNTWLLPLKLHSVEKDTVYIVVPDANFLGYLKKKYTFLLKITIEEVTGIKCEIEFVEESRCV